MTVLTSDERCTTIGTRGDAMGDLPTFRHRPVLLAEVVDLFTPVDHGLVIDATLGGGGHAAALALAGQGREVLGVDRDPVALEAAEKRFADDPRLRGRLRTERGRFDSVLGRLDEARPVVGVLFDLGVSSPQLDVAERGFSYRVDAPLDMRMDPDAGPSAADLLAEHSEHELAGWLRTYGDERFAGRIAKGIVAARPVTTTGQLVDIVTAAIPAPARRRGGHPAKRTFQALRIVVNSELDALSAALAHALDLVEPGGRIAVISYHSGEDRIVKSMMRDAVTGGCECPVGLPCGCGAISRAIDLTRGGITPSEEELASNPRASSARLRGIQVTS